MTNVRGQDARPVVEVAGRDVTMTREHAKGLVREGLGDLDLLRSLLSDRRAAACIEDAGD